MNAGFSNLSTLKGYILAAALRGATDYDAALTSIGQGVAKQFEKYCNRKFARSVGDTVIFSADRCEFILPRVPLEALTLTELKTNETDGFVAQDSTFIRAIDLANGIINTGPGDAGPFYGQVRFTYTGGFFWEQLEPADGGYPTSQPGGSTALPADLLLAWQMQCAELWKKKDKLGEGITTDSEGVVRINPANLLDELLPTVKAILAGHIRYNLT
jgi:hypothetical protein